MTNKAQKKIIEQLKMSMNLKVSELKDGAIGIETQFLDWKGFPLTIYVTREGRVTDGGGTINELAALRVIENFKTWKFKEDFYQRYGIQEQGNELNPISKGAYHLLSYVQGIARLGHYFKPNPITAPEKDELQKNNVYDKLNDVEVAGFLEMFKNKSTGISDRDEAIIMQAVKRLRKYSKEREEI